ncbi:hypothetical protein [Sedimentibacter sp.]|uniref:hypothetical protein n=1 Tax=Sedimentibacter sp. TaxID=1960295 RepID=UPI00289B712C|nr:hypothetical protein [Sedimentibacter sp.]
MDNYRPENIEASMEDLNIQCDKGCGKTGGRCGERGMIKSPCVHDKVMCAGNNSSLLFFFLILVVIVCQSDCDIEMDTLMWFFLLLVALYKK